MDIILGSRFTSEQKWKCLCDVWKRKSTFTLTSYSLCISTPILKLEMIIFFMIWSLVLFHLSSWTLRMVWSRGCPSLQILHWKFIGFLHTFSHCNSLLLQKILHAAWLSKPPQPVCNEMEVSTLGTPYKHDSSLIGCTAHCFCGPRLTNLACKKHS